MALARSKSESSKKPRRGSGKDDDKPKKKPASRRPAEEETESDGPELEDVAASAAADSNGDSGSDREERDDREENGDEAPAPAVPQGNHAVRDDDLQEARLSGEAAVADSGNEDSGSESSGEPAKKLQILKLTDLKRMKITELSKMSHNLGIEGTQGLKKQELLVAMLGQRRREALRRAGRRRHGADESAGHGFLRSADSDYQPSPDDIYVSPSQVRRFGLRPGDTVSRASIRQPREG